MTTYNNKNTIHSIQYLRGIAALMVVLHHTTAQIVVYKNAIGLPTIGVSGVDIFFIISGFVIWYTTANKKINMQLFLEKRIIRVVPLYWLMTLTIVIAGTALPNLFSKTKFGISEIISSLMFIPHYSLGFQGKIWPILVPGWTLNYEMAFYAVFGLLLFFSTKKRSLILLVTFCSLIIIGYFIKTENAIILTYTNNLLIEFVIGVYIAKLFLSNTLKIKSALIPFLLLTCGICGLLATNIFSFGENLRGIYYGIPAALIVISCLMIEQQGLISKFKLLHLLGDASYSIYLAHTYSLTIIRIFWQKMIHIEPTLLQMFGFIVVSIVISSCAGIAIHLVVEKPLTRYLRLKLAK